MENEEGTEGDATVTEIVVDEEALLEVRKASYSGLSSVPTRTAPVKR